MKKCCFCGKPVDDYGNNPYPANKDPNAVCCALCNWAIVIPARLHAQEENS